MQVLSNALNSQTTSYDFTLVDCAPSLDILTVNALMVATDILVPVSVDFLSAAGTRQHMETIEGLREVGGVAPLRWVVPTDYERRIIRAREIMGVLDQAFGPLLTEPIRRNTRLAEAPHVGQTIFEYDPKALGAEDYAKLVRRVINDTTKA